MNWLINQILGLSLKNIGYIALTIVVLGGGIYVKYLSASRARYEEISEQQKIYIDNLNKEIEKSNAALEKAVEINKKYTTDISTYKKQLQEARKNEEFNTWLKTNLPADAIKLLRTDYKSKQPK